MKHKLKWWQVQRGQFGLHWDKETDSVMYWIWPWWYRPIYRVLKAAQWVCWKAGWSWHDEISQECCPDFSCCVGPRGKRIRRNV